MNPPLEAHVTQFHEAFDIPIRTGPATVDYDRVHMRMALIGEEFCELVAAVYGPGAAAIVSGALARAAAADAGTRDVIGAADALGDLTYVIAGMALESGIPLPAVLTEIHASNMSKLGADGQPLLREDGKVLKGPAYSPPDIARVLRG